VYARDATEVRLRKMKWDSLLPGEKNYLCDLIIHGGWTPKELMGVTEINNMVLSKNAIRR
jgi:hypothetical protein